MNQFDINEEAKLAAGCLAVLLALLFAGLAIGIALSGDYATAALPALGAFIAGTIARA